MSAEKVATTATIHVPRIDGGIIHPKEMYFGNPHVPRDVAKDQKSTGAASIRSLLKLADTTSSGPSPSFAGPHILLAFLNIANSSYVGRSPLARRSGLGEGAARTVLKRLKKAGYVDVIRSGCFLTRAGTRLAGSIGSSLSSLVTIPMSTLTMGDHQAALALRGVARNVRSGIEQRDSAIRIGASGATTFIIESGKFTMPGGSSNCEKDFPSPTWSLLKKDLSPKNDDVVILCGGADEASAKLGALAAAMTLL
jgi:hypothetical protein